MWKFYGIVSLIFLIADIAFLFWYIRSPMHKADNPIFKILGIIFIPILAFMFIVFYSSGMYGPYSDLVKKYNMTYHESSISTGNYTINNLKFAINNIDYNNFEEKYHISDYGDYSFDYHYIILSKFLNIKKGSIEMIYENLSESTDVSKMTIINNHCKVEISLNSDGQIDYSISKSFPSYTEGSGENKKVISNNNYLTKYVKSELHLIHSNDNYKEFDQKLIELLFDKDINSFKIEKDGINIRYIGY